MSSVRGDCVVAWLERSGGRFLKAQQPDIYDMLMLHVGGTDTLKTYSDPEAYWQSVQVILDCFFSAAERAEMCTELIEEPAFLDDPGFLSFRHRARAEIRCRELILMIEETVGLRAFQRSVH
ncbi:MAG: hypothetical protein OEU92_04450 [Alphaproteobacteria bacterium]|nr:hypothetical protein [Alphaproteobacteria bacterium]